MALRKLDRIFATGSALRISLSWGSDEGMKKFINNSPTQGLTQNRRWYSMHSKSSLKSPAVPAQAQLVRRFVPRISTIASRHWAYDSCDSLYDSLVTAYLGVGRGAGLGVRVCGARLLVPAIMKDKIFHLNFLRGSNENKNSFCFALH